MNKQKKLAASVYGRSDKPTCGRKKRRKTKQTNPKKTNKHTKKNIDRDYIINRGRDYLSMQKPSSLPSLRERSGALDRRVHWETQETPVAQSHLSASVCITAYRRSGCRRGRQESILSAGAESATQLLILLGIEAIFRPQCSLRMQANEPSQLPVKNRFKVKIYTHRKYMAQKRVARANPF